MAKMKLSQILELLKDKGVTADDIEDDETGLPVTQLRSKAKDSEKVISDLQAGKKVSDSRIAELEPQVQAAARQIQELTQAKEAITKPEGKVDNSWRSDPLFATLVPVLDQMIDTTTKIATAYAQDRQLFYENMMAHGRMIDKMYVRGLKQDYKDFDEEKVRAVAKRENINDWDKAYKIYRDETSVEREKQAEARGREAAVKELEAKAKAPIVTEGMTGSPPAPPLAAEKTETKEYNKVWGGLVDELKGLGVQ